MNIIDQLLKPGYQVTDEACNAYCYQVQGCVSKRLATLIDTLNCDDIVVIEVNFISGHVLVHKADIEEPVGSIRLQTVVDIVYQPHSTSVKITDENPQ